MLISLSLLESLEKLVIRLFHGEFNFGLFKHFGDKLIECTSGSFKRIIILQN